MLAGTHILTGAAIYRLSEDKPWWIRWPAVIGGGFLSHYMLDSMASYHDLHAWFHWPMCGFVMVQAFAVGTVLLDWRAMASGLWAWLSWDWERLAGVNVLHGGCTTWAPRYFSECSSNPWTGLWEVGLVLGLAILVWRWRDATQNHVGVRIGSASGDVQSGDGHLVLPAAGDVRSGGAMGTESMDSQGGVGRVPGHDGDRVLDRR